MQAVPLVISVTAVASSAFLLGTGMPISGLVVLVIGIYNSRRVFKDRAPFEYW